MAAKILANLIVIGGSILARGVVAAYRQALQNATKNGVAQETIQNVVHRGSKEMTVEEARLKTHLDDVLKVIKEFNTIVAKNAKKSFYHNSKTKVLLEAVQRDKGRPL